jgi:hypothetical protein
MSRRAFRSIRTFSGRRAQRADALAPSKARSTAEQKNCIARIVITAGKPTSNLMSPIALAFRCRRDDKAPFVLSVTRGDEGMTSVRTS